MYKMIKNWEKFTVLFTYFNILFMKRKFKQWWNHMGGVIVSVLTSSVVDYWFKLLSGKTKDHKIGISAKIGWLWLRIMCPSGVTCLPANCCFSELVLKKIQLSCVGLVQHWLHHHHLIEINLFSPWYSWKIAVLAFKQQSLTDG